MAEMLSITTPAYSDPSSYQHSTVSRPVISRPTDVVIKVHAGSVNPIDVKLASGMLKLMVKDEFPYKLGYDCSGVVAEVGDKVTRLKVGDEVYARLPEIDRGAWSEYARCMENFVALKPKGISFGDAASLPLAAMTALQALRKYKHSLAGKTVFVPAGLGGTGAYACQLAKNVFHAGKVITTVSTAKVDKIPEYLGHGVVDQVIDYTKEDPMKVIPPHSVDFVFDTTSQAMSFLPIMIPSTSMIISISTQPSGAQLQNSSLMKRKVETKVPFWARVFLDGADAMQKARANWSGVEYEYMFLDSNAEDLDLICKYVDEKLLVPVVGTRVDFHNIEGLREACNMVYVGKGGIGKVVIDNIGPVAAK